MSVQFSRVLFIANPHAGVKRNIRSRVIAECEKAGMDFTLEVTQHAGHATELAASASEMGFDLVVAIGGDGTINEVGRALLGADIPLGVVPAGSGNAFARALNLSLHPAKACRAFIQPEIRKLDVGRVGNTLFFSTAGIGLDAEVAHRYANRTGRRGFLPYLVLTALSLLSYRPQALRLKLDSDSEIERTPLFVVIANMSDFGGGATIAPQAMPDDGLLDVCVFTHPGWIRLVLNTYRLFNGTFDRMPGVEIFQAKKIHITREKSDWFQFDGEVEKGPKELVFEIMPGALTLILPKNSQQKNSAWDSEIDL